MGPRAGPLRRLTHPPPGVQYIHVTDRVPIPTSSGHYGFSPVNVALAALKFTAEHSFPLDQSPASVVHTFFWDVRKFNLPWFHESDQSLGQYLTGYNNVGGTMTRLITEGYSSYLNSRGCRGVVTWTKWAKKGFEEDGVDPEKVAVIPPPFDTVAESRRHAGCNVLFLGRDFLRKGGDTVLKAFRTVDVPDCRLTYVGKLDGGLRKVVGRDQRITYYERPSNKTLSEDIWPYVDILALPSRADAFAMTIAEAMSRGIPVVASSIPSVSELVEDGVSGYLVRAGDTDGVAQRLGRLAEDAALRARMGHEARERARNLFSPADVGSRLMEVYARAYRGH